MPEIDYRGAGRAAPWRPAPNPGLWLGLAICASVCFCPPVGVVGIVYASMAMGAQSRGDLFHSERLTKRARTWTLWSVATWLVAVGLFVAAGLSGMFDETSTGPGATP